MFLKGQVISKSCWRSVFPKLRNTFLRSNTAKYQYDRQSEFRQRLHFQYEYTNLVGGRAYAWTLTYNNTGLSDLFGINVHDYRDVRKFLKSLSMYYTRHYGVKVEYAVFCELGEGKGERGEDANPHYHILVFFVPVDTDNKYYDLLKTDDGGIVLPSHNLIFDMARYFWQGGFKVYDSRGIPSYVPQWNWEYSKYGSISYSKKATAGPFGFITNSSALNYAVKYCTKDKLKRTREYNIRKKVCEYVESMEECIMQDYVTRNYSALYHSNMTEDEREEDMHAYLLWYTYNAFESVMRFVNSNYSPKPRCSMGLGHYDFVADEDNGFIKNGYLFMPDKSGVNVKVLLKGYYFRKYFYRVQQVENEKGQMINCYRPSVNYLLFKNQQLDTQLDYTKQAAFATYQLLGTKTHQLMIQHIIDNNLPVEHFAYVTQFPEDVYVPKDISLDELFFRYSLYKNIYEFRYCKDSNSKIDYRNDFQYFLISDYQAEHFLFPLDYVHVQDYSNHTYFVSYIRFFYLLDLLADYSQYLEITTREINDYKERQKTINLNQILYES